MARPKTDPSEQASETIKVRATPTQYEQLHDARRCAGYRSMSRYLRDLGLAEKRLLPSEHEQRRLELRLFEVQLLQEITTRLGQICETGFDSEGIKGYALAKLLAEILTSRISRGEDAN